MKLQKITILVFCALLILVLVGISIFFSTILLASYHTLEEQYIEKDLSQAVRKLDDEFSTLSVIVSDWGPWDDTYNFVNGNDPNYIWSNLQVPGFDNLNLNLIIITNNKGEIVYSGAYDLQKKIKVPIPASVQGPFDRTHPLMNMSDPHHITAGIWMLPENPMIVASTPIVHSDFSGKPQGVVIMGRYLDKTEISRLAELTQPSLAFTRTDDPQLSPGLVSNIRENNGSAPGIIQALNSDQVSGYALIRDIFGNDALILQITESRDIYHQGLNTTMQVLLIIILTGSFLGLVIIILLDRFLLKRMNSLAVQVYAISTSGSTTEHVKIEGDDELSTLASEINRMLDTIEQTQQKVQVSEARFRGLAENMPLIIFEMNTTGRLLYVNKTGVELFGITEEKITQGNNIRQYLSSDNIEMMERGIAAVMSGGRPLGETYTLTRSDGTLMQAIVSTSLMYQEGKVSGFRGIVLDISERIRLEEALIESEKKYRAIAENTADILFSLDLAGIITYISPQITKYGFLVDEIIGKSFRDLVHPEDIIQVEKNLINNLELGASFHSTFRILDKWGNSHWFDEKGTTRRDQYGNPVGIYGVLRDDTIRKRVKNALREAHKNLSHRVRERTAQLSEVNRNLLDEIAERTRAEQELKSQYNTLAATEENLRQTKEFLENLISIANVPIIVWDPSFRITRLNHAFELLIGRSAEEVVGNSLEVMFPPDQADHSLRLFKTTLDGVRWETTEIDIMHRDGSRRTLLWNSATLYTPDGVTPVATIAQGHDITGEMRLKKEKDAALVQIQLNLAHLAILNDGIRNPLTIILAYADMFNDAHVIDQIALQVQRIDEMVNNLDQRWTESEKVLNAIRKHYLIQSIPSSGQEKMEDAKIDLPVNPIEREESTGIKSETLIEEVQAQLYTILDSIDALVYAADIDTYDLLFMNRHGRALFGDIAGQKCYQIMHNNQNGPCSFCTNLLLTDKLESSGGNQCEYQNTRNGRWYDCRDRAIRWSDGRVVRLEVAIDITERKLAETALKESEEKYRTLTEYVHDGIYIYQGDKFVFVNDRVSEISGFSKEELYIMNLWNLIDPADHERVKEIAQYRLAGKPVPHTYETRIITKEGSIKILELAVSDIPYNGQLAALGAARDITERKRSEETLRESEEKFKTLFESAGDAIFIMDNNVFIECNRRTEDILQCTRDQIIGHSPAEFSPERQVDGSLSAEKAKEKIDAAFCGDPQLFEWVHIHYDHTPFMAEVSLNRFMIQGTYYLQAIVRDITDRKLTEDELLNKNKELNEQEMTIRLNEKRLLMAQEIGQTGCWEYTLKTDKIWGSAEGLRIFGFSPVARKLSVDEIEACIHERDRVHQALIDLIIENHEYNLEYTIHPVDGSAQKVVHSVARLEIDEEGNPLKVTGIIQDITVRKLAEEALQEANHKLHLLTSLTNHDILNQVSTIQMFLDMALQSSNTDIIYEYLSESQLAGEQIEKTIGFTREYENFGIVSCGWQRIHLIIDSAKAEVSLGKVRIDYKIPKELEVYADPIIRKVFTTLMENSIRHGGNVTNIRFFCLERKDTLIITCEDDGVGISSDEKELIFDHGYGKNTGIGLFLATEILSITGLSIRECGIPEKGARFEITLPAGKWQMSQNERR